MSVYPAPLGIRFNDCLFTEPERLAGWRLPKCAGLFAILGADQNWAPKQFQPLYFGEFGNNAQEDVIPKLGNDALFVAVFPMPFSTTAQRCAVRDQLLWAYNPVYQSAAPKPVEAERPQRRRIGFLPDLAPALTATGR